MPESPGKKLEKANRAQVEAVRARIKAANAQAEAQLAERSLQVASAGLQLDQRFEEQEAQAAARGGGEGTTRRPTAARIFAEGRVDAANPLRAAGADQGGLASVLGSMSPAEGAQGGRAVQQLAGGGGGAGTPRQVPATTTTTERVVRPREVGTRGPRGGGVTLPFETTRELTRPNVLSPFQAESLALREEEIAISREAQDHLREHRDALAANDRRRADAAMMNADLAQKKFAFQKKMVEESARAMNLDELAGMSPPGGGAVGVGGGAGLGGLGDLGVGGGGRGGGGQILSADQFAKRNAALFDEDRNLKTGTDAEVELLQRSAMRNHRLFIVNPGKKVLGFYKLEDPKSSMLPVYGRDGVMTKLLVATGKLDGDQGKAREFLNDLGLFDYDEKTGTLSVSPNAGPNAPGARGVVTLYNKTLAMSELIGGHIELGEPRTASSPPQIAQVPEFPTQVPVAEERGLRESARGVGERLRIAGGTIPRVLAEEIGEGGRKALTGALGLAEGLAGTPVEESAVAQAARDLEAVIDARLRQMSEGVAAAAAAEPTGEERAPLEAGVLGLTGLR